MRCQRSCRKFSIIKHVLDEKNAAATQHIIEMTPHLRYSIQCIARFSDLLDEMKEYLYDAAYEVSIEEPSKARQDAVESVYREWKEVERAVEALHDEKFCTGAAVESDPLGILPNEGFLVKGTEVAEMGEVVIGYVGGLENFGW